MALSQKQIQHFFLRTGFGEIPEVVERSKGLTKKELIEQRFKDSALIEPITHLKNPVAKAEASNMKVLRMMLKSKKQTADVSLKWTQQMADSNAQLREKMTFFWHDHFATKVPFAYLMQEQNNTLRKHALGNFREMLHAMAKDPAMLLFLNNQQNKKRKPNENFAREVMELFTLGEGNYTEQDIKEAARAFTGWQVNRSAKFELVERHHDFGSKTIFGQTGNFSGVDVLDMLLEKQECAQYICTKLYRFLISHQVNEEFVQQMTDVLYDSDYDIELLLRFVLDSDEFFQPKHIGTRIVSPTELLVRYIRTFNLKFRNERAIQVAQKALGQVPLFPPNVSGWVSQRGWIDSTSLLYRMRLPLLILNTGHKGRWRPEIDWSQATSVVTDLPDDEVIDAVIDHFIQADPAKVNRDELAQHSSNSEGIDLRSLIKNVMALPEFQLI